MKQTSKMYIAVQLSLTPMVFTGMVETTTLKKEMTDELSKSAGEPKRNREPNQGRNQKRRLLRNRHYERI